MTGHELKNTGFKTLTPSDECVRFHCASPERPKRKGKLLKRELEVRGYDLPLSKCHDLMAQMYDFRNLRDLYDHLGYFGRSLSDEDADDSTFGRRIRFQVNKLLEIGVSAADAEEIVDWVRPTGAHASFARSVRPLGSAR
jgi:hypothetical protein